MDDYVKMLEIARKCIGIIKSVSPDEADYLESFLDVGEPDLAVAKALDITHDKPELLKLFPESVRQLTKNSDYPAIQIYAGLFDYPNLNQVCPASD